MIPEDESLAKNSAVFATSSKVTFLFKADFSSTCLRISLNPDIPAVLAGHVSIDSAKTSSEKSMMLGKDYILLKSSINNKKLDYIALGHIHKHQILNANPMVVYPGSLERVDFSEENDTKVNFGVRWWNDETPQNVDDGLYVKSKTKIKIII
mgnify:CR=1 FL=1